MKASHALAPTSLRAMLTALRATVRTPSLLLWALYVLLFPVYIFPSGVPQPGDLLVIIMTPVVFGGWRGRFDARTRRVVRALIWFTAYVFLSAIVWSLITGQWSLSLKHGFVMTPTFYIYNVVVFVMSLILYQQHGERFLWLTVKMVIVAALMQVAISLVFSRGNDRSTVLFNNPNQLGYYAILSASIILLCQRRLRISTVEATVGLLACGYLALLSSSKAALGCVALIIAFGIFNRLRTVLITGGISAILLTQGGPVADALDRAQARIETDKSFGFFEERGYDRITEYPEYWVLGSGEGYYKRFEDTTVIGDHELHSSAGTLFFCYGVFGTIAFGVFGYQVVRGGKFRHALMLLPAAAYGMTHQGLRFTLLWMMLAIYVSMKPARKPRPALVPTPPGSPA